MYFAISAKRTLLGLSLLTALSFMPPTANAYQAANTVSATTAQPETVEWVYRIRYGFHDEWLQIFRKYQIAILVQQKQLGYVLDYTVWGSRSAYERRFALIWLGHLAKGDFVVITAASGSVGIAAIEMVKVEGAISIAVTRTAAKKSELLKQSAYYVIVTDEEDLVVRVNEITSGKGARIVFDPIGVPRARELPAPMQEELPSMEDLQELFNKLRSEMESLQKKCPMRNKLFRIYGKRGIVRSCQFGNGPLPNWILTANLSHEALRTRE
jgi:hypothetical protein